ncbi:hypothetical protein CPB83DRAFT_909805 [Crepidotus variabilis]|uniref:Uncharacterized protein n=1 Tax=Crepidotus variabilis TaxID=179855 RepID=A0A9P6E959_9AGAR|nr:hypothetical protein CPB83DRAFT_909805 [Crepidotus variabilis]
MNKFTEYLRQRKIDDAVRRFRRFHIKYEQKYWYQKTLEELDNIPSIRPGKAQDEMETAARMMLLADAYWALYCEHYESGGASRGQKLQLQAYDILWENLDPGSACSRTSPETWCRWDLNPTERRKMLDRCITFVEYSRQQNWPSGIPLVPDMLEEVVLCSLRNGDYSDDVKALQLMWVNRSFQDSFEKDYVLSCTSRTICIHLERQEWDEAETVITRYLKSHRDMYAEVKAYANLGEVQIRRRQPVKGEATLRKGMAFDRDDSDLWSGYLLCREQLMGLYMQQKRWNEAKEIGLALLRAREDQISGKLEPMLWEKRDWNKATQKAARVIEMNRWRAVERNKFVLSQDEASIDSKVYYLHMLYNNKRQLAVVHMQLKQYNEAQQLLEGLMEDKMHMENPILVASKEHLVTLFIESGQPSEAEKRQEKTIEEMTERFGYDSKKLIPNLERLADIYQENNHLGMRHHVKVRLLRYR